MSLPHTVELRLAGLRCAGCVQAVEGALRRVPGVRDASVNLATGRATVELVAPPETGTPAHLVAAVRAAGYGADWLAGDAPAATAAGTAPRRPPYRLVAAVLLGAPLVVAHLAGVMGHGWWPTEASLAAVLGAWGVQAGLAIAVLALAGGPMLLGAGRALLVGRANMDLLVSLGALTALGAGLFGAALGWHEFILFDATVMIVLFVALGKTIEERARARARGAFQALLGRLPQTAWRVTATGIERVPADTVRVGDRVRVPAHEIVPVDGEVIDGQATLDESMLTGESLPVERGAGQTVLGGTRVAEGSVDLRATATGRGSAAARMVQLVEQALAAKPPWQRLADRVAAVFVPVVLVTAAATFAGWKWGAGADTLWALQRMIATLVVACPCALGLAIPTAVLVGTTRAAEQGVLVRHPAALEAAGHLRHLLLDKTGTLTIGRPAVTAIEPHDGLGEDDAIRLAAAAEQVSSHPLARAVVSAARQRGLALPEATDLQTRPGGGVRAQVAGQVVVVGSAAWLRANGVETAGHEEHADTLGVDGATIVWLARQGRVAALFSIADPVHPESSAALASLRRLGVRPRILSGDRHAAVSALAGHLGVADFEAELTPEQKLERVRALAATGARVGMVGDGINDAPALAAADVGIAIGTGADVAREAADICLVGHSPRLIARAIELSRRSTRIMRENLFWAVIYNAVMVPLAVFTPLPPAWAAAAMMASSLSVVGNALRLRRA